MRDTASVLTDNPAALLCLIPGPVNLFLGPAHPFLILRGQTTATAGRADTITFTDLDSLLQPLLGIRHGLP